MSSLFLKKVVEVWNKLTKLNVHTNRIGPEGAIALSKSTIMRLNMRQQHQESWIIGARLIVVRTTRALAGTLSTRNTVFCAKVFAPAFVMPTLRRTNEVTVV